MAKQDSDLITLDLFNKSPKIGRPRTNPLSREEQLRINKRNQLLRNRYSGLKRVELKLHADMIQQIETLAKQDNMRRGEFIEQILQQYLLTQKNRQD